jgi:hypothetical protein
MSKTRYLYFYCSNLWIILTVVSPRRNVTKQYLVLERTNIRKMYTKLTALVLVAALAAVLITSTLAISDDAYAWRKSQSLYQKNFCFSNCQNAASQIQGSGNFAIVVSSQR